MNGAVYFVVLVVVIVVFEIITYKMAVTRSRNPAPWMVFGFFFPIFAVAGLAIAGRSGSAPDAPTQVRRL